MGIFDKTKIVGTGKKKVDLYPLGLFRKLREKKKAVARIEPTAADHMVLAMQHVGLAINRLFRPTTKVTNKRSNKR